VALRDHDSRVARSLVLVLAGLLVLAAAFFFVRWILPGDVMQESVIRSACRDAGLLHRARLLTDARAAFAETTKVDEEVRARGSCAVPVPAIEADVAAASEARERGEVYLAAYRLKRGMALELGRKRALRRARRALAESAAIDPYHEQTRRDLRTVLAAMPGPQTRAAANARCRMAGRLRAENLLPEAAIVYGQALRTGKNTKCVANGLLDARRDVAEAQKALFEARSAGAAGASEPARRRYLAALAGDPALSEARTELAAYPGPDPQEAKLGGRVSALVDDTIEKLGEWVDWLVEHAPAIGFAAVALLLVVFLAMALMMLLTRLPFVRGGLAPIRPLRRFTRPRTLLAAFTPEDKASSAGAVFAHHLSMAPILVDPQRDWGNDTGDIDQDTWEAPSVPNDPLKDAATLFGTIPQANFVAATMEWLRNTAPRREVRILGQMLDADERGHGMRVLLTARSGRSSRSFTAWTKDLPGPQLPDTPEARGRHAVAVRAAAWAHAELKR
jgi:hypothetical protein